MSLRTTDQACDMLILSTEVETNSSGKDGMESELRTAVWRFVHQRRMFNSYIQDLYSQLVSKGFTGHDTPHRALAPPQRAKSKELLQGLYGI